MADPMDKEPVKERVLLFPLDSCQSTIADIDAFATLEPLCVLPPENHIPDHVEQPTSHATNPTDEPNEVEEYPSIVEPDRELDMFDNEEEYVGVNDESMFMAVPLPQYTNNANNTPPAACVNADAFDVCAAHLEAEIDDDDPLEVHVIHDPENPDIKEGGRFPDIISFRKAIRHYAVKKGFEFAGLQTDPTRFIAKCKAEGCPWRIHASRIWDGKTIEKYMPQLAAVFCHVIVDVSSIMALCIRWYPKERKHTPRKQKNHRAMDDIKESIAELKYYKDNIFKPQKSKR